MMNIIFEKKKEREKKNISIIDWINDCSIAFMFSLDLVHK